MVPIDYSVASFIESIFFLQPSISFQHADFHEGCYRQIRTFPPRNYPHIVMPKPLNFSLINFGRYACACPKILHQKLSCVYPIKILSKAHELSPIFKPICFTNWNQANAFSVPDTNAIPDSSSLPFWVRLACSYTSSKLPNHHLDLSRRILPVLGN